jgi:hypothetical protein
MPPELAGDKLTFETMCVSCGRTNLENSTSATEDLPIRRACCACSDLSVYSSSQPRRRRSYACHLTLPSSCGAYYRGSPEDPTMSRMLPQNDSVHRSAAWVWEVTRRHSTCQVYVEVQRRAKCQSRL